QARVGYVHVLHLNAPGPRLPKKVRAQGSGRRKVHAVGAGRYIVVGEQSAATQLEIRHDSSARGEVPLQIQRIEARPESSVRGLKHHEYRHRIERVLESAFQKARAMRPGKDPSIAQPGVPYSRVGSPAWNRVAASRPQL